MADDDIDSLLEAGIKAAAKEEEQAQQALAHQHQEDQQDGHRNDSDRRRRSSSRSRRNGRAGESRSRSRSKSKSRSRSRSRSSSRVSKRRRRHSSRRRGASRSRSRSRSKSRRSSRRSSRSRSRSSRRSSRRRRRSRSRSRSNSRDNRGRRSSHRRGKSRSKSRSKSRNRSSSQSSDHKKSERPRSTSAERAEKAKQRELMELTRDHRTVFIGQLTQKVREKDLHKYFSKFGKLEHVLLIRDKFTNRSKGFAYVELSNLEDVPKILLLNGQVPDFQVFPIMVKASEAEKNFAAKKESAMNPTKPTASGGFASGASLSAASRIYCGNLHTNITEDDLRCVFQSFGEVVSVHINRDEMGRSKGFGFIQFSNPQEANLALSKGNGLELAGNALKLGCVNENAIGMNAMGDNSFSNGNATWKLEDDEGAGLSMTSQSRTALMAKLASGKGIFPTTSAGSGPGALAAATASINAALAPATAAIQRAERAAQLASGGIEGSESFCFVIKNMFDVVSEKRSGNPGWHEEIQQDVQEECSSYGKVLHCFVEKEKEGGLVYVLFDKTKSAVDAAQKLHGRWFNRRQISVRYLSSQEYVGMFPQARPAVQTAKANDNDS